MHQKKMLSLSFIIRLLTPFTMEEQILLFEMIKHKISDRQRLADVIEELLGVSSDSAYRRMRGETELTFSELKKICDKFNLSMDEILNYKSNQGALFRYDPMNLMDPNVYVNRAKRILDMISNVKSAPDKEVIYNARNIPLYHFVLYPELSYFNLYAWNNIFQDNAQKPVSYDDFCINLDKEKIVSIYQQLHHAHTSIPTKEIWTVQTVSVTLKLLEYFYTTKAFGKKNTVLYLLEQLSHLMDTVHQCANDGHKGDEKKTPFFMYNCSIDMYHNCMLVIKGDQLLMSLRLHMLNFIETDNEVLCNATLKWQRGLITKSTLISGESSEMQRFRFFESAKNKIENLVKKIN